MARTITNQIRVKAPDLCRALRAAAAFADSDKKSHRHVLNLRTVELEPVNGKQVDQLVVAGGNALRAIVVNAGAIDGYTEPFDIDITPKAAALIVSLFAKAWEVELKSNGKTLTVTAADTLFDNQRIEVRAVPMAARADALLVARRMHALADVSFASSYRMNANDIACVAAASKTLGAGMHTDDLDYGSSKGLRVRMGSAAVAYLRSGTDVANLADVWIQALAHELADPWAADHIDLGHVLDAALPIVPPKDDSLTVATDGQVETEKATAEVIDLDTYAAEAMNEAVSA